MTKSRQDIRFLFLVCLLSVLYDVTYQSDPYNFYVEVQPAYSGGILSMIVVNMSIHNPVCGWQLILTCDDYSLTGVDSWQYDSQMVDPHTFILTCKDWNQNLLESASKGNLSAQLYGNFGNQRPTVRVYWYAVCDQSTGGQLKLVPQPYNENQNQDLTTAGEATTTTTTPTTTTTTPSTTIMTKTTTTTTPTTTTPLPQTTTIQITTTSAATTTTTSPPSTARTPTTTKITPTTTATPTTTTIRKTAPTTTTAATMTKIAPTTVRSTPTKATTTPPQPTTTTTAVKSTTSATTASTPPSTQGTATIISSNTAASTKPETTPAVFTQSHVPHIVGSNPILLEKRARAMLHRHKFQPFLWPSSPSAVCSSMSRCADMYSCQLPPKH